jgi:sugar/nucleoside kinase (ribokinase family)
MGLISFGTIFLEVVFGHFDRLPQPGQEIYVDPFAFSCGGGAITSAVAASRAGASASLGTRLGDDLGSRLVEELALREGVDLSASARVAGPVAGITVVLNFDGDRAFVSHMPARPAGEGPEVERWAEVLRRERPEWCLVHARADIVEVMQQARQVGTRVALDVSLEEIDAHAEHVVQCARLAEVFLPTEQELLRLTGAADLQTALDLASSWCPWLVVKRGAAGAVSVEGGRATEVTDGLKDVVAVDRTGAGDAFAGALIGTVLRGAGRTEAVAAGNGAGSEAVARLGSAGSMSVPAGQGKEYSL